MKKQAIFFIRAIIFSMILSACALMIPAVVQAKAKAGTCGSGINWSYDTVSRRLTITGTGKMDDYSPSSQAPWFLMNADNSDDDFDSSQISRISLGNGITHIGSYAFYGLRISTAVLPSTLKTVGDHAFAGCDGLELDTLPTSVEIIGESAFSDVLFTKLVLPPTCNEVGKYAFSGMTGGAAVPSSVAVIGKYAFGYYASGSDDSYTLTDETPKKDIRKVSGYYIAGPKSSIASFYSFKYAKSNGFEYRMKDEAGPVIKSAANVKTRRIKLKWKKVSNASGYQIRYSTSDTFASGNKYITITNKKTTSKKTAKLKKNTTYYIGIRYYKKVSSKKCFSEWSETKTVTIKK